MSVTDPEHDFGEDVVISGDKLRGFTADETVEQHDIVQITGDYEVSLAGDGEHALGAASFDRADGQEVTIGADDCEVRVIAGEAIGAGMAVTPDGDGGVREAEDGDVKLGIALTGAGAEDIIQVYLTNAEGEEAV